MGLEEGWREEEMGGEEEMEGAGKRGGERVCKCE